MVERRPAQFRLTEAAHAGLDRLATRHGITKTALIEALGLIGADRDPTIAEVIALARQLDRERRSRR